MPTSFPFRSPTGSSTVDIIVQKLVKHWPNGLKAFQKDSILKILDRQQVLCITATGDGKSALFAIPILVHSEIGKSPSEYPQFHVSVREKAVGLVVTPTKGLANNIVRELGQFNIAGFAYTHDNVSKAKREGRKIVEEIAGCRFQVICVDPEHLQEPEWWNILNSPIFRSNIIYACAEECHLVNEWGLTFRPAFQSIGPIFTSRLPSHVSKFALTATLQPGPSTLSVCKSLGFSGPTFHLIRRSNERPNTRIIVQTLTSSINGSEFPQLIPYLNDRRKTVIHAETIRLGYQIFLYLFSCLQHVQNPLERIRMYNSLAPDGYNEKTVELLNNDARLQAIITTQAFTNGMHAKALTDSICVKAASTQDGSEQRGGRVGRDEETVGRRIILVTPNEFKQAKKVAAALPTNLDLTDGFPSGKVKSSHMDPAKAYFLTETKCRVACINRIYQNPPISDSGLDCVAASRLHPCDLCCSRYHIPEHAAPLLRSSNTALALFSPPSQSAQSKLKRGLTKKQVAKLMEVLDAYENTLWLEESYTHPHAFLPRSAYLPKSLTKSLVSAFSSIKSLADLERLLSSAQWTFRDSQASKLFNILRSAQKTILSARKQKSKAKKKKESDTEDELDEMDVSDDTSTPIPATVNKPPADSDEVSNQPEPSTSRKRAAQSAPSTQPRAKRKPAESAAVVTASYGPAYRTSGRTRRARCGDEEVSGPAASREQSSSSRLIDSSNSGMLSLLLDVSDSELSSLEPESMSSEEELKGVTDREIGGVVVGEETVPGIGASGLVAELDSESGTVASVASREL
ncbi:hypothetical protein V5O48_016686 [Marasmius crinis-equi]|uniref:DNA 3'-5' helicase n=1 Tax=Marasmius crinis-equi TaxID=585013 RepID=A0ABR3ER06_9AGAR